MFKTFMAELKYMFKTKLRALEYFMMLLIPFVYGFFYMNAYWTPFKHVDELPIVAISLDDSEESKSLLDDLQEERKLSAGAIGQITIRVKSVNDIYNDENAEENLKNAINHGKYSAGIVIPKGFGEMIQKIRTNIIAHVIDQKADIINVLKEIKEVYEANENNRLTFYNDYKNSYLAGEMTNFGAGLNDLVIKIALSVIPYDGKTLWDVIGPIIHKATEKLSIIDHTSEDSRLQNEDNFGYGFGLSPYFVSIALWAGVLVMTFLIKNERYIKTESTFKHYFGKWLFWVFSGIIQATILITAITIQGVNIGISQWQLYLFAYFTVIVFASIVQAVAYSIRFGDIGEFAVVILLVLQLISSSGTFPVEMQTVFFKIIHPIAPFTYSIQGLREILFQPDSAEIGKNIAILLVFPIIFIPISLFINFRYDIKTRIQIHNCWRYKSFEIHVGDM